VVCLSETIDEKQNLVVSLTKKEAEELKRIAALDYMTPEELLVWYAKNRVHAFEENSLVCDDCGKKIKEGEKYFVNESSFSTYEKENDRLVENKADSWSEYCICLACHDKRDARQAAINLQFVKDHDSQRPALQ